MLDEILPAAVAVEESFVDPDTVVLLPEEEAAVARAVAKRRAEYATVRQCARAALRRLGVAPGPILPGERGAPRWPLGVVGSLTHCAGYRAAALALDRDIVTIGIDAEPHEVLPEGVLQVVSLPGERALLDRLATEVPGVCWDRLLFSAKESVYKAWFPLTRRWLDFGEAAVEFDPASGRFVAELLVPGPAVGARRWSAFPGRYLVRDGLVITAIAIEA